MFYFPSRGSRVEGNSLVIRLYLLLVSCTFLVIVRVPNPPVTSTIYYVIKRCSFSNNGDFADVRTYTRLYVYPNPYLFPNCYARRRYVCYFLVVAALERAMDIYAPTGRGSLTSPTSLTSHTSLTSPTEVSSVSELLLERIPSQFIRGRE